MKEREDRNRKKTCTWTCIYFSSESWASSPKNVGEHFIAGRKQSQQVRVQLLCHPEQISTTQASKEKHNDTEMHNQQQNETTN